MPFVFRSDEPEPIRFPLALGDSEITLIAAPPSAMDRLTDDGQLSFLIAARGDQEVFTSAYIRRGNQRMQVFKTWDNVVDAFGKPVPFSLDALRLLIAKYPAVMPQINRAMDQLYSDHPQGQPAEPVPAPEPVAAE